MSLSLRRKWSLVFGMGTLAVLASVFGILKTRGGEGEHFGSFFAGVVLVAIAVSATRKPD